jgi:hypothetical protein
LRKRLRAGAALAIGALTLSTAALTACGSTTTVKPAAAPSNGSAASHATARKLIGATADGRETLAISMGDSFISGEGASLVGNMYDSPKSAAGLNAPNYRTGLYGDMWGAGTTNASSPGWLCHRSTVAEIHSAALPGIDKSVNLACSGAKTPDVTSNKYQGLPPQLTQLGQLAENPKYTIKTIVLSIGGNDLQFSGVIKHCLQVWLHNACGQEGENATYFTPAIRQSVLTSVVDTIKAIQRSMDADGYPVGSYSFILQSYPRIFAPSSQRRNVSDNRYVECPGTQLSNETVDWAYSYVSPWMRSLSQEAAKKTNIKFLDLTNAFAGHTMCDVNTTYVQTGSGAQPAPATKAEWVAALDPSPVWKGVKTMFTDDSRTNESFHPNYYGQLALGTCLNKMVASGAKSAACSGAANAEPSAQTLTVTAS